LRSTATELYQHSQEVIASKFALERFISAVNNEANQHKRWRQSISPNFDPERPEASYYLNNKPRVETLQILTQEHESLQNSTYEIFGISMPMRNVTA
jgi:hypothetical protein